ncbi:MAG TPA: glycosyltransferase family 4 protein [Abditibacterium sp.]|jgi:glycosyltransferase involved in cell wall biosynthesis
MRVVITSLYLPSGSKIGVGYQVHGLANALVKRGHEVMVASACTRPDDALYSVQTIPPRRRGRTFGFAWDLRRVDFSKFDVLNAHGDDWFLWGVKKPRHVHTFHGSLLAEMLNGPTLRAKLRSGLLAICETQTVLMADDTVSVSQNTRRYVPKIRHIIPCGVDLTRYSPGLEKSSEPSLLFVGTMHGRKRGRMLLEKFQNEILPQFPDAQMWCVCEKPADMGETPNVKWFGRIEESVLTELYARAWVFCLPSSYEGFGVPYIEAMASGTPMVATPNLGALEVTQNGKDGLICNEDDLGPTILRVLGDANLRASLIQKGLERSKEFGWDRVCERYEAVYAGK